MFNWLRKFFYSGDPDVKVADGLSEFEAGIAQELLKRNGIVAMAKDMSALRGQYGQPMLPSANHFALWVKQSDAAGAIEALEGVLDEAQLVGRG